jgi:hypothetical protein
MSRIRNPVPDLHDSLVAASNLSRPLFVLSIWRSGSSLLYALLNQHSKIALLYEGNLPQLQLLLCWHFRSGRWRERWEFWNQGPSRHGIAIESIPTGVTDAWEAARIVYQQVARRRKATVWGEKTPHAYDNVLTLADKFPDARFIFLWRDMNAVIESIRQAALTERFFRKPGIANRALIGNEKLKKSCEVLKGRFRLVHEVNYEDLTSNTSECMRHICLFLELPFESRITSIGGAERSAIFSGQHHAMVRSERVVGRKGQSDLLSSALKAKVNRYICLWKRRYDGEWPKYPLQLSENTSPPSLIERCRDRVTYQVVHGQDKMTAVIYGIVPLDLARRLRSWIRQHSRAMGSLSISF